MEYVRVSKDYVATGQLHRGLVEINIDKDDIVVFLELFEDGWLKVEHKGKIGVVPFSHIDRSA